MHSHMLQQTVQYIYIMGHWVNLQNFFFLPPLHHAHELYKLSLDFVTLSKICALQGNSYDGANVLGSH